MPELGATFQRLADSLKRAGAHFRERRRVLAGCGVLALVWAATQRLPEASATGVSGLLGEEIGGLVAEEDFLWLPGGGAVRDLIQGRDVAFLGRDVTGAPRDVYQARIHLTPSGRPLVARAATKLAPTFLADEGELGFTSGKLTAVSHFDGRAQSVVVFDLTGEQSHLRVSPSQVGASLAFEVTPDTLLLADVRPSGVDLKAKTLLAGSALLGVRLEAAATGASELAQLQRPTSAAPGFPPPGFVVQSASGAERVVYLAAGSDALAIDGRLATFELRPGRATPLSQTGYAPPNQPLPRTPLLRIVLPDLVGGAVFAGAPLGPLCRDCPALVQTENAGLRLATWAFEPYESRGMPAAVEWRSRVGDGRHALCVTPDGHLVVGAPERVAADGCAVRVEAPGKIEWQLGANAETVDARPSLWVMPAKPIELPPLKFEGKWQPAASIRGIPDWLDSAYSVRRETLGTTIELVAIDMSRFDWRLRAGTKEKSHRFKGEFLRSLSESELALARFSLPLGVGKRRGPRGLRIDGSTGHRFRGREGALVLGPFGLEVWGSERSEVEPRQDGSELPLSVSDGKLTPAARDRGPLQPRVDLCVKDGVLLVASAVFDTHQATAGELISLGCSAAVALDRGSEPESALSFGAVPDFAETTLVGLARELPTLVGDSFEGLGP